MKLNDAQKNEVAAWFAAGANLDEIQKRIKTEFGVHMTYLDVRLLVAELPQPEEPDPQPESAAEQQQAGEPAGTADAAQDAAPEQNSDEAAPDAEGGVRVTIDPICPPGVIAGGQVTFSDGTAGKWYLDQMGRMGLADVPPGYRPPQEDVAVFQDRLVELLRSKGLA